MIDKIIIGVMICLSSSPVLARSDSTVVLQELVIRENRLKIPFQEASRNITAIDRDVMLRAPVQSLPEILSYVPGVDIRQRGPLGVQADIGIRGGTFEQTLVMINGIKLTDPQTGHHVLNVPLHFDNLERIEVLKGGGARIFGQNAFAGAVNFITAVPDQKRLNLRGYGGGFGSYGASASLSLPAARYRQYMSLSYDASAGYRHNTDYSVANAFYQSGWEASGGELSLMFGLADRQFGANGFYASPAFTEQYEAVRTGFLALAYERQAGNWRIQPRVYFRSNRDLYRFVRDEPGRYQNLHQTGVLGIEMNASVDNALGTTGLGLEWRSEWIQGDWLRGGQASKSNLDGFNRGNAGVYAEHRFRLSPAFDLVPGVYTNWSTDFGFAAFPGIDLGYNLSRHLRAYGHAGKSYRVPTFYDQHYQSPVEQGDPNLVPEEAWSWELGFRYLGGSVQAEAVYFNRDARLLIDWVYDESDSLWRARNFNAVLTRGLELSGAIDLNDLFGGSFPESRITASYNFIDQLMDKPENLVSRYALENIRHQVILGADLVVVGKLRNSFRARYIDRMEQPAYWILDDRLSWEQSELWAAFLEVTNLTDQFYTEVMTPMPGRWVRLGLRISLALN
jgi:vitamin B12 transporter